MSTSVIFSGLSGVQSLRSQPHLCFVIGWGKHTPSTLCLIPTRSRISHNIKILAEGRALHAQSPPHMYRGPEVMNEQHYFCIGLLFYFLVKVVISKISDLVDMVSPGGYRKHSSILHVPEFCGQQSQLSFNEEVGQRLDLFLNSVSRG